MANMWHQMRLGTRFMVIVAAGVAVMVAATVMALASFQQAQMERKLYELSVNELTSLHALIVNVMAKRPEDGDNIGIAVFNNWFASRNSNYPGELWSVWSPKVVTWMAETEKKAPKLSHDAIDDEALKTGKPVSREVGGFFRYSYPIVLGVTDGANQEVCHSCHGAMGLGDGDVIAVLSSKLSMADGQAELRRTILVVVAVGLAFLVISVVAVNVSLNRVMTRPIGDMTRVMARLAAGDVSVAVPGIGRSDEMGDIAHAVESFKDNAVVRQRMEADSQRAAAARDQRMHHLEDLISRFQTTVAAVLDTVASAADALNGTARAMAGSAHAAKGRSASTASAAAEASDNVQMVAGAADELSSSITEIARQVSTSTGIAATAKTEADGVQSKVQGLAAAAEKIGEIVSLITDIAANTNLLALNATIEAARAGDAGKGFSVVAAEVKGLANQTMRATTDISNQVATIQTQTRDTVGAIREIARTISDIDGISAAIAAAVEQQGAATKEIAGNIDRVARAAATVTEDIDEVSQNIGETERVADDVLAAAGRLSEGAQRLRDEINNFLRAIRET